MKSVVLIILAYLSGFVSLPAFAEQSYVCEALLTGSAAWVERAVIAASYEINISGDESNQNDDGGVIIISNNNGANKSRKSYDPYAPEIPTDRRQNDGSGGEKMWPTTPENQRHWGEELQLPLQEIVPDQTKKIERKKEDSKKPKPN